MQEVGYSKCTKNMWKLDFFTSNKDDQIMVQRISNRAEKINENIIGGYTAVLPFYINFQSGAKTEKSVKKNYGCSGCISKPI